MLEIQSNTIQYIPKPQRGCDHDGPAVAQMKADNLTGFRTAAEFPSANLNDTRNGLAASTTVGKGPFRDICGEV